ncbi:MAG: ABC transporter permease [Gemmatimonadaceae bacterium]
MAGYLLRRALQSVAILFVVATLTFFLLHAAPGDPLDAMAQDSRLTLEQRAALRERYGLNDPLPVQYGRHLLLLTRGDLGYSIPLQRPVSAILADAMPHTMLLMGVTLALSFAAGIGLGALQGARADSRFDRITSRVTTTLATLPEFWLATGMMLLFAHRLHWFPVAGMVDPVMHPLMSLPGRFLDVVRHLVLPVSSLLLIVASIVARYQRSALLDTWNEDYLRTARAAGVPWGRRLFRHALRNALLPIVTLFGLALPSLVGGALFIESVFAWPGVGRLAADAVLLRDFPLVLGVVMAASVLVAVGGLLADVMHAVIDPRVRA